MPEDEEDDIITSDEERDMDGEGNDSELEEYYRELDIEPAEMKTKEQADADKEAIYKKKKKKDGKKEKVEQARLAKSEILEKMMEKARNQPSVVTLSRII